MTSFSTYFHFVQNVKAILKNNIAQYLFLFKDTFQILGLSIYFKSKVTI